MHWLVNLKELQSYHGFIATRALAGGTGTDGPRIDALWMSLKSAHFELIQLKELQHILTMSLSECEDE